MSPLEECCFICLGCGLRHCTQNDTSPGETDNLCPSCWLTEDDRAHDDLLNAHDGAGWNSELGSWVGEGWSA